MDLKQLGAHERPVLRVVEEDLPVPLARMLAWSDEVPTLPLGLHESHVEMRRVARRDGLRRSWALDRSTSLKRQEV